MQEYIHYFLYGIILILPFLFIYKIEKNEGKHYKKLFFTYVILFWFLYLFMILQLNFFLDEKMNLIEIKYEEKYFDKKYHNEILECDFDGKSTYEETEKCIKNIRKNYTEEEKKYLEYLDTKYGDGGRNVFALFFGWLFGIIYFYIVKVFIIFLIEIHSFIIFLYKKF